MTIRQPFARCRPSDLPSRIVRLALFAGTLLPASAHATTERGDVVAIFSSVSPAYLRTRQPDGAFEIETYAFGEGGLLSGSVNDPTIDRLRFLDIAHVIAPTLAEENYVPCNPRTPQDTKLLIMVYWGRTTGTDRTSSASEYQIAKALTPPPRPPPMNPVPTEMEVALAGGVQTAADSAVQQSLALTALSNHRRDQQNTENATILGYLSEVKRVSSYQTGALQQQRQDLVEQIAESRYYVVLMAYDFPLLQQRKGRKLLWETRFSIPQRRNDFTDQLGAMARAASRYYGKDSGGLLRNPLPIGHVELGEGVSLGPVR
ncbi:MAG: hypothetical protein ABIZ04_01955 [Opitutus sp.]